MAKTAAKISIQLEAQTATLKKGFDEAKAAINNLDRSMSAHVARGMAVYTAAMLKVTAVIGGLQKAWSLLAGSMAELDRQQKMAARLGMTADALVALERGAKLSGMEVEQFSNALRDMTKNVSTAALTGTGKASDALHALGVNALTLNNLATDKKLSAIANALNRVANPADRAQLAMRIFGEQGFRMINVLEGGSGAIEQFMREADRLGLTLGNKREQVEEANDAIDDMKTAWRSLIDLVAVEVAPTLTELAHHFRDLAVEFREFIALAGDASIALAEFTKYAMKYLTVAGWFVSIRKWWRGDTEEIGKGTKKLREETDAVTAFGKRAEEVAKSVRTPFEVFRDTMEELNSMVMAGVLSWDIWRRAAGKALKEWFQWDKLSPGVGAVTRTSMAGYSAFQTSNREREERSKMFHAILEELAAIEKAVRESGVVLAPKHL